MIVARGSKFQASLGYIVRFCLGEFGWRGKEGREGGTRHHGVRDKLNKNCGSVSMCCESKG